MKGEIEGLSFESACRDFGINFQQTNRVCVLTNHSACKGICQEQDWKSYDQEKGANMVFVQLIFSYLMTRYVSGVKTESALGPPDVWDTNMFRKKKSRSSVEEIRTNVAHGL